MRILITGSRQWSVSAWQRSSATSELIRLFEAAMGEHADGSVPTIVHGAGKGADRIIGIYAASEGWPTEEHPAKWNTFGAAAGPIRNQIMVDLGADLCLGFPLPGSRGTYDCMERARKAGIKTVQVTGNKRATGNGLATAPTPRDEQSDSAS